MAYAAHRLDIYEADLYLATDKAAWKAMRRQLDWLNKAVPECGGQAQFTTVEDDNGIHVPTLALWINRAAHPDVGALVNTIAHEAVHAAGQLLNNTGHRPIDVGEDEPLAYLTGWLTQWIWDNSHDHS
jgi:hypothetical protein